jgi:hypothetical protein
MSSALRSAQSNVAKLKLVANVCALLLPFSSSTWVTAFSRPLNNA